MHGSHAQVTQARTMSASFDASLACACAVLRVAALEFFMRGRACYGQN